jgi:uncharacterized sporulation protein YeaH/YhbH (DUF444 family)
MAFIFIDRRKAGKGKSTSNRQKLIKRIKNFIKVAEPKNIGTGGVSGTGVGANNTSPIKVSAEALEEPHFLYAEGGEETLVFIGNFEYDRGDVLDFPQSSAKSSKAGLGENGEDDFIVNIARDEFLDLFFEDCELPNLSAEKYTEKLDVIQQQAGFSTSGNPAQLSIIRTYKQSLGRRWAIMGPYKEELRELKEELEELTNKYGSEPSQEEVRARKAEIEERIMALHRKMNALDCFENADLRYRKKEARPLKTVDAVLIMSMDISGSMDENKKKIARRWFALLYAFIKRRYTNTELVFIAHTEEAFEMNEQDFFTTKINGGTKVSAALELINNIIKDRYDTATTNIYVSHASDGDNYDSDNPVVKDILIGDGHLMNKIQFFNYVEVGSQRGWLISNDSTTNLWDTYDDVRNAQPKRKVTLSVIEHAEDCYPIFKRVFRKENS